MVEVFGLLAGSVPALPPDRSQAVVIGSGLLALALVIVGWPIVGLVITIAHEGAHAATGSVAGGKVKSIILHRDRGGETNFVSGLGCAGGFLTALAGYLGPSIFGLVGAMLLAANKVAAVLWLSLVLLVLALLQAGNLLGRIVIIAAAGLAFLAVRYASAGQQAFFAHTWIWFLLIGGFGHVLALQHVRGQGPDKRSDAHKLKVMSLLPASLWSGFFWIATLAALCYGAAILLGY